MQNFFVHAAPLSCNAFLKWFLPPFHKKLIFPKKARHKNMIRIFTVNNRGSKRYRSIGPRSVIKDDLKESDTRFSSSGNFHESVSLVPLNNPLLESFWICKKVCGNISKKHTDEKLSPTSLLAAMNYTSDKQKTGTMFNRQFQWHGNKCTGDKHKSWEYIREFSLKWKIAPVMGFSWARGKLIHEKKLKSEISCQTSVF